MLTLPGHFLAAANLHFHAQNERRETGGWLLAHPDKPDRILGVTGPGRDAQFAANSVELCRRDIDAAAAHASLLVVGNWHTHLHDSTEPTPTDLETWRFELARSKASQWAGVILGRDDGRWTSASGWCTFRNTGATCRFPMSDPLSEEGRARAHRAQWALARGPLARSPHTWEPHALQVELQRLQLDDELEERIRRGQPQHTVKARPAPVIRRIHREDEEVAELRRRLDWHETHRTGASFEAILEGMQHELKRRHGRVLGAVA